MSFYTTEDMLAHVARRDRGINNTANTPRDCNTARGINTQYTNIEYTNIASNLADEAAGDWLASPETSSPVGESKEEGLVGQEEGVKESPPSGIINPAGLWGIEAQQCVKKTKTTGRPSFHLTLQFNYQLPTKQAALLTAYTEPADRYRDYKPETEEEIQILNYVKEVKAKGQTLLPGRFTQRGRKGSPVDGLLCYAESRNDVWVLTVLNTQSNETVELIFDQPVTPSQALHYTHAARWGNSLDLPGKRKRVSIFEITTLVGGAQ